MQRRKRSHQSFPGKLQGESWSLDPSLCPSGPHAPVPMKGGCEQPLPSPPCPPEELASEGAEARDPLGAGGTVTALWRGNIQCVCGLTVLSGHLQGGLCSAE